MSIAAPNRKLTKFFPIQKEELLSLYRMGLIKCAAYTYFALKLENPFCDRPVEIIIKEFALKWGMAEKSLYRAIARLKELEILDIKSGKLIVAWVEPEPELESDTNEPNNPKNETDFSEMRDDSQKCEPILRSENQFSEVRIDSQNCENRPPKEPPDKNPGSPQTLQTYSDFIQTLSESERENFLNFVEEKTNNLERQINDLEAWLASKNAAKQNRWEVYHKLFKDQQQIKEKLVGSRLYKNKTNYTLEEKQAAIARFKAERQRNRPEIHDNPLNNPENRRNNPKNE